MFFNRHKKRTQVIINAALIGLLTDLEVAVKNLNETLEEVRNDLDFVLDSMEDEYGN